MYVVLFCSSMIRMLAYIRKFGNGGFMLGQYIVLCVQSQYSTG